jgi:hypothetical protein
MKDKYFIDEQTEYLTIAICKKVMEFAQIEISQWGYEYMAIADIVYDFLENG